MEQTARNPERGAAGRDVRVPREFESTGFDRFAERTSRFVSKGAFFTICLVAVVIWMPTIAIFHSVDTWQLVINTLTSVLAFLLIALLQNSERRYDEALHQKIDVLAAAMADLMQHRLDDDPELLRRHLDELRAAIGIEQDI
jgi:low affinity Fe/Cu permease